MIIRQDTSTFTKSVLHGWFCPIIQSLPYIVLATPAWTICTVVADTSQPTCELMSISDKFDDVPRQRYTTARPRITGGSATGASHVSDISYSHL